MIFILIFVFVNSKFTDYIFPFYNFSMHNHPVIWKNKTKLENEIVYYKEMRKLSLFHVVGSSVISLITLTSMISPLAPIPITYWSYYVYMNWRSSHLEQNCEFNIENDDVRFEKRWHERIVIPEVIFNPISFLLLIYIFTFFLFWSHNKKVKYEQSLIKQTGRGILFWIMMVLVFVYTYSFIQTSRESRAELLSNRDFVREEIKWKCHVSRMNFWRWLKINVFSLFGIQSDGDGYALTDECKELIIKLERMGDSFAEILYKTLVRPKITIIKEIFSSVNWLDKILMISLGAFIFFLRYLFKKKNGNTPNTI